MKSYDRTAFSKDDLMAEFFLKPTASIVARAARSSYRRSPGT